MYSVASGFEVEIPAVLFVLGPALVFVAVLYLTRLARQRFRESQARNWTPVDATVNSSYEVDENSSLASPNALASQESNAEYVACWATAIQYTYHANGEIYAGTYFLPGTWSDGHLAAEAGRAWVGRKIVVRYNPVLPEQSVFLEQDGAPGRPHISRLVSDRPYVTGLSLK
jgi:hypothetical protein